MRRAARRDEVECEIVEALRAAGARVRFLNEPDLPDLLVGYAGKTVLLEVKSGRAKLRPGQAAFAATWRGGPVWVVRSKAEALAAVAPQWERGA